MKLPTLEQLFQAGAHFGHPKQKAHPKARQLVWGVQKGMNVIDLEKSLKYLKKALEYIQAQTKEGKNFLVVSTKKQLAASAKELAQEFNWPYVDYKWPGGTLTNFETIKASIKRLASWEELKKSDEYKEYTKKEKGIFEKKLARLKRSFGGLKNLTKLPDNLLIIDAWEERIALKEARDLGIPVVAITDTNWNPDEIDYVIPVNDDVLPSVKLVFDLIIRQLADKMQNVK